MAGKNVSYLQDYQSICNMAFHLPFFGYSTHLLKTPRNCLSHSGFGKCTKYMWNADKFILWQPIVQMCHENLNNRLKSLPKITDKHITLNSYSKMTAKYAVQVLSSTLATVITHHGPPDASETAKFCKMMDSFFDCMNARSYDEYIRKRKPYLKPYSDQNGFRFDWLINTFLAYFEEWKNNIEARPGDLSENAKGRMFIS